jgi:hypothetical protein
VLPERFFDEFWLQKKRFTKEDLKKTVNEPSKNHLILSPKINPRMGKILGDKNMDKYLQKTSQEYYNYRMGILEDSYNKILENQLDKPLNLFLQAYDAEEIRYFIYRLSQLLKKIKEVSEIKKTFSSVAKPIQTNDTIYIQEWLSLNLIELLNGTFTPFFSDPRNTDSLDILYQRASGFTLQDIAEKRNLTQESIRRIELKCSEKLAAIIRDFPCNILTFIRAKTDSTDYISADSVREYLNDFQYNSQLVYLLENEDIYKEYQYNKQYNVFYNSGLELDFSMLDINSLIKEPILKKNDMETSKKIEDFLIAKNLAKCTYDDICKFTSGKVGCARVAGNIIQLSNNIVEIKKNWYVHRSCIIGFDEAAGKLLMILQNQFKQFHGYSNSHSLFNASCIDLAMFMNDNDLETESTVYMLAKHLFFKEKYNGRHFYFTEGLHIWEKQTGFPLNNKGVLINLAKAMGGIITREETEEYLENLKLSKNVIITKMHDISDSTFYFYTETTYILSEYLQIDESFVSKMKKSLDRLFDNNRSYIIPSDINEDWFDTLPKLPLDISWNLLLLQEVIRYNEDIGYKPLFSNVEQSPYRLSGAFVKANSDATLVDIIYDYTHENFELPHRASTDEYRKFLQKAGFLHGSEWFTCMHKVFNDTRFAFSNENKLILVRKQG